MDLDIRILLADDHALEASDGDEAVALAVEHRPDVAVVDITMPKASGFEVTARIRSDVPSTNVLVLSMHDEVEYVMRAVRAGASGYLLKRTAPAAKARRRHSCGTKLDVRLKEVIPF